MAKKRIAINGFGRIGRLSARIIFQKFSDSLELVAVNDLTENETLSHLFKYDTAHGVFPGDVSYDEKSITINGSKVAAYEEKDPAKLPWKDLQVDMVLECTGRFTDRESMSKHLEAGAKKVVLSAPAKGDVKTIVLGVNDDKLTGEDNVLSNASCTTNCLAPLVKVINDNFGIKKGYMTTIHAYTADQNLQDGPHRDLRRARSAALNIVPTSTGAAKAIGLVLPEMKGKLDGFALRVPVVDGSVTDLTVVVEKNTTTEEVNAAFKKAANGALKNYLVYSTAPLVSSDIVGNPASCIFDAELTMAGDNIVKVMGWYDNEFGYANRLVELAVRISEL